MADWSNLIAGTAPHAGLGYVRLRKSAQGPVCALGVISKSIHCDDTLRRVTSVITTPLQDIQGDVVSPDGADLSYHRQLATVLYDHGYDYKLPVGKSEDPSGNYTVRRAGDRLVADTYFAADRMGEQLYELCKSDTLRGWSPTFVPLGNPVPLGPVDKSLGRPPFRFDAWKMLEYSVTPNPINPEALTILEKGRAAGGALHPVIAKSLRLAFPETKSSTVVVPPHALTVKVDTRVRKAMDGSQDPYEDAATGVGDEDGEYTPPTAKGSYNLAQGIEDLVMQCEQELKQGEHVKGKKKLKKICEDLRALAAEANAVGDGVHADLSDDDMDKATDEPAPVEKSAEGWLKNKAGFRPHRWTVKDLAAASTPAAPSTIEPARKSRAARQAEREAERKAAAVERLNKKLALYGQV